MAEREKNDMYVNYCKCRNTKCAVLLTITLKNSTNATYILLLNISIKYIKHKNNYRSFNT